MSIGIVPTVVIAVGAVPALLGVLLLRLSMKGRRGDQPHCRGCDYLLIGIRSSRCPECGRELLPRGIVRGEQRLDRLRLAQSFAFVLFASACMRHTQVVADASKEGLVELDQPDLADQIRSVITVEVEEVDGSVAPAGTPKNLLIHPLIPMVPTSSSLGTISASKPRPSLVAKLTTDGSPVNIAFEVSVRMGTREVNAGLISMAKAGIGVFILEIPDSKTSLADVGVVLRSSAKAARESVDVSTFWKGEIAFPSVKINRRGPNSLNTLPAPHPFLQGSGLKRY